jgi:hypothetical protein
MDKLARLPAEERRDIFSEAAARLGVATVAGSRHCAWLDMAILGHSR